MEGRKVRKGESKKGVEGRKARKVWKEGRLGRADARKA